MTRLNWAIPVGSLLRTMQKHDIALVAVFDGEDTNRLNAAMNHPRRKEAVELITSVDESRLYVTYGGKSGWVDIVLGNDCDELAADWSASGMLEALLQTAIDEYNDRWTDRKCPTTAEAE
jgi:ribosomal protein S18 acetylase RimI-like enzyme